MSILGRVLLAPVLGPIQSVLWLARMVDDQARAEIYSEDKILGALAELELKLELGEVELADFEAQEEILLRRLKEAREARKNGQI